MWKTVGGRQILWLLLLKPRQSLLVLLDGLWAAKLDLAVSKIRRNIQCR